MFLHKKLRVKQLVEDLKKAEHGFKYIIVAGEELLADKSVDHFNIACNLMTEPSFQARMLATYLLGKLWTLSNNNALQLLKTKVAKDDNLRVQEMLAKVIDSYCKTKGYENSLIIIQEWLNDKNPNLKRAVIEGLRIWTGRPYFQDNPLMAIKLISEHKNNESEYVRKSAGNALRDIGKKHKELVLKEIATWDLTDPKVSFTQKLVVKNN